MHLLNIFLTQTPAAILSTTTVHRLLAAGIPTQDSPWSSGQACTCEAVAGLFSLCTHFSNAIRVSLGLHCAFKTPLALLSILLFIDSDELKQYEIENMAKIDLAAVVTIVGLYAVMAISLAGLITRLH